MRIQNHPASLHSRGSALLVVLAFLLLLTTLTVAFLGRATLERLLSSGSVNQNKVDLVAQGAISTVIGDLQKEIVAGSNGGATTLSSVACYYPTSPTTMVPYTVGFTHATPPTLDGLENLVKISYPSAFYSGASYNTTTYPAPNRASSIATTTASLNNRTVSAARWNKPLLMPKATPTSTTDFTPVSAFVAPNWINVARDGSNPTSTTWDSSWVYSPSVSPTATPTSNVLGTNPVLQRFAYAIYDEGSTLDMNVAGSPSYSTTTPTYYSATNPTTAPIQPYKSALAYADLTQLPYISAAAKTVVGGTSTVLTTTQEATLINAIVGWRNNASTAASGSFPAYTFTAATSPALNNFDAFAASIGNGFMGIGSSSFSGANSNQTDNAFASRQQLMQFLLQGLGGSGGTLSAVLANLQNAMPYLGTFSRDISQPSYVPPASRPAVLATANGGNSEGSVAGAPSLTNDNKINPTFLATTVTTSFTRNDGSKANVGEPLVKKRFALNRLAWITYKGPSALRTMTDADMVALMADGIPQTFLLQGTAANIQKYFGLDWDSTNHVWDYDYHNNGGAPATGSKGPIMQLGVIAALATPRDPDFFELLKATINVGSIGKALSTANNVSFPINPNSNITGYPQVLPYNWNYYAESSVDYQILQIGANIIAQFQPANYAPQIVFNDNAAGAYSGSSTGARTIVGVENLPYLSLVTNGAFVVKPTTTTSTTFANSGVGAWMQVPVVWDPYDPTSSLNGGSGIGPTKFRVVADSTTPDQVGSPPSNVKYPPSNTNYNCFFVYGAQLANYSYNGSTASTAGNGDYTTTAGAVSGSPTYVDTTGGSILANAITANNSAVDFTVSVYVKSNFCPEPVALVQAATIKDSNGNSIAISLDTTSTGASPLMKSDPAVSSFVTGGGLPSANTEVTNGTTSLPTSTPFVGFYLGAFPLSWMPSSGTTPEYLVSSGNATIGVNGNGAHLTHFLSTTNGSDPYSCFMTYRVQYQDPNNASNWITYDTKYGQAYGSGNGCGDYWDFAVTMNLFSQTDAGFFVDPRTSRFGMQWTGEVTNPATGAIEPNDPNDQPTFRANIASVLPGGNLFAPSAWLDPVNGIMFSARPDSKSGFFARHSWYNSPIGTTSGWMAYVASDNNALGPFPGLAPGLLSQNNTDILYDGDSMTFHNQAHGAHTPQYFADPDGIVRRGMGAHIPLNLAGPFASDSSGGAGGSVAPADTTVGLPMAALFGDGGSGPSMTAYPGTTPTSAAPTSQAQSRPYFLHRPFYSVAELGYVFSDTPWRNLDFFTAESGNAALLDTFCINDTNDLGGLVAGKVNLNTRQVPVLQAVLASGYFDPAVPTLTGSGTAGQIDSTTANLVAAALVARTTDTANVGNGTGPLQNVSELVGKYVKSIAIQDLGSMILNGTDKGTLASGTGFYDGKVSYAGFSGGVWDNTTTSSIATSAHCPYPDPYSASPTEPNPYTTVSGGVENFSASPATGPPQSTTNPEDVYSALMKSTTSFTSNANHNGTRETVTYVQRYREAPIRALAAAGTTRVWNLMIDVIAQTGRFPATASSLANFNVEGERRYWVHVAIDRYTGKVLDEQIEEVKE